MKNAKQPGIVAGWDTISAAYQKRYRISADDLHFGPMCPPNSELTIIKDFRGRSVLEIGCGGGQNIIYCARSGAGRCVGVDPSAAQLAFARRLAAEHQVLVDFKQLSCEEVGNLKGTFDLVLSAYAMMYVEDLPKALKAVHERLRPGGHLVLSVDHPFRLAGEWEEDGTFKVRDYFATGWQTWDFDFPESRVRQKMHRYHRTVSDWVQALLRNGFSVTDMHEPLPSRRAIGLFGTRSKYAAASRQNVFHHANLRKIPGTLILEAISQ